MMKSNTQIKLVFCIPDMIVGGMETVFVNTINELLKYGFDISIITHRKITEPLYVKWLSELKGLSVYTEFSWSDCFKKYAAKLSCYKRVMFTGKVTNPYPMMHGTLANILSSEYEGLPTTLIESLALERLAVSSSCKTGPSEILEYGKSGLLFDIGDSQKLTDSFFDRKFIKSQQGRNYDNFI